MTGPLQLLDTAPAGASRLRARAIDGSLLYTDTHVWAWWRLPLTHLDYLTEGEQEHGAIAAASTWAGLAGHEVHVLTAAVPRDPDGWARTVADDAYRTSGDWRAWTAAAGDHLRRRDDLEKSVYVGVQIGERRAPLLGRRLAALFGKVEAAAGVTDHVVAAAERERWRRSATKIGRPLEAGALAARPANADELAWLIAHAVRRGQPLGPLPIGTRAWGAGVNAYRQVHEPAVLGGAMPTASAALGDGRGPYLGYTTGRLAEQPVHYSPWESVRRREQQRETTIAVTGSLGGGKTVTLMSIAAAAWRAGARVVAFDPKGDLARLAELPGADVDVVDLTDAPDGVLDPWTLIEDPDAAKMVALEAIDRLVAGRAQPHHRTAIDQAVEREARSQTPSLSGVVERLEHGSDAGREIASTLQMYRTMPLARLAFRPPTGRVALGDGITIITTPGVEYPPVGTPLREMSWPQRLAVTATYLVGTYARRVALHAEPDRPKLIALDEAWALTSTDQGRALIAETSRMGRSRKAALLLASQSAVDLADDTVRNCISTVIAHRIGADREADAVAALLGVTPSPGLTADLYDLRAGEAVMRDLDRRVGRIQVDVGWDPALARLLDLDAGRRPEIAG